MRDGPTRSGAGPAAAPGPTAGRLPPAFTDLLLDSALEPVLDAAVARGARAAKRKRNGSGAAEIARSLLSVTVCDPACGSGELLAAAAGRIAARVADAYGTGSEPEALRRALREVVGSCVYGVDPSAAAVELARDRLRQAAGVPGLAPSFLDARIRQGNALIGASPEQIENGIPDAAFRALGGEDRGQARALRRANARPGPGQATLFSGQGGYSHSNADLARSLARIGMPGVAADDARRAAAYAQWRDSAAVAGKRLVADAWCAAFTWPAAADAPPAVVNQVLLDLRERGPGGILPETLAEIGRLSRAHGFFHWDLEFPDVFRVPAGETRWRGGFSCVLSAVPAEQVARRGQGAAFRFATLSGTYPQCTAGLAEPGVSALRADLLFAERAMAILAPGGLAGCVLAQGSAAAPGARYLLGTLLRRGALTSLYDFTGPDTGRCLLSYAGGTAAGERATGEPATSEPESSDPKATDPAARESASSEPALSDPETSAPARFAFRLASPAELGDTARQFTLTAADAALVNPNTGALPPLRGARDAALVTGAYRRIPALWDETRASGNPWKMRLERAFRRATADAGLLRTEQELRDEGWEPSGTAFTRDGRRMLPFYEPAMIDLYDHAVAKPRFWVAEHGPVTVGRNGGPAERPGVADRLAELGWRWEWLCVWRVPGRERPGSGQTAAAVLLPRAATADSLPLMLPRVVPPFAAALVAALGSSVVEYIARQKADGPAVRAAFWKQLPVPTPEMLEPHLPFIVPRVLELVYTSSDLSPLARDLDDTGDPFAWDTERRAALRAELDAFFFRLYGMADRDDVAYVTDTLQAGADGAERGGGPDGGDRHLGRLTTAAHDRMAEAEAAGASYETRVFPPPGHGPRSQSS